MLIQVIDFKRFKVSEVVQMNSHATLEVYLRVLRDVGFGMLHWLAQRFALGCVPQARRSIQ
jgi:hypothetical protein